MNGQPERRAGSNSADAEMAKESIMSDLAVSQKSGSSTPPPSTSGSPAESQDESRRVKQRTEIRMFWALASRLIKLWGGKLQTIEADGVEYLSISFPLNRWQRTAEGVWLPTDLVSADAEPSAKESE